MTGFSGALVTREVASTIVHSDRGSQFRSHAFVRALGRAELRGSMGRVATCADNAAMESFFSLLQKNVLDTRVEDKGGTPSGHRHLDRTDLQPSPASSHPRTTHAGRI
jgi:transposase InsO family protein